MTPGNNASVHNCNDIDAPFAPVIFIFGVFPFHVLVMKTLAKNLHFALPRHSILFSLCLSDGIQVSTSLIVSLIQAGAAFTTDETACQVLRGTTFFAFLLSLIVSSAAIITLSVERYIACIHSFRLHQIVTESRVFYGSIGTWAMAIVTALTALFARHNHYIDMPLKTSAVRITTVVCTFPVSVIVIVIQCKLYLFSRKKLVQVTLSKAFGAQLELAHYRKKHMKLAFVAGIVALVFVLCAVPFACICFYELINGGPVSPPAKLIFGFLAMGNAFLNPFIYGLGMVDIRKKIWKELKMLKEYLAEFIS